MEAAYGAYRDDENVEEDLRDYVDTVWDSVSKQISDNWLQKMQMPLASDISLVKLNRIVSIATTSYDGDIKQNKVLENHIPDDEPVPVDIDPWARGTVPTRKIPQGASSLYSSDFDVMDKEPSVGSLSSVNSFSSYRSGVSKQSKQSRVASSVRARVGTANSGMDGSTSRENGTGDIIDLDEDGDDYGGNLNATGHLFDMLLKTRRKVNNKKDDGEADEFKSLKLEIAKATKDLKGKKFVLDADGKPITILSVKAEQLPPYAVPVGLNITTKLRVEEETKEKNTKHKKVIRIAGSRDIDESFFTAVTSLASTLSGGGNISLNAGVSLKSGDGSLREGPLALHDPKKVTRKNFFNKPGTGASTLSRMSQNNDDNDSTIDVGPSTADSFGTAEGLGQGQGIGGSGSSATSPGAGNATLNNSTVMSNRYGDVDPLQGGRKKIVVEEPPPTAPQQQEDTKIKNKPAVLPTKPSSKQQENIHLLAGGTGKQLPRDKVPLHAQIPVASMKHLAPPELGKFVGHGIVPTLASPMGSPSKLASIKSIKSQ